MAYAAVISLKHTINSLVNSYRISLVSSTREILESAYNETTSLQKVLERLNDSSRSKSSRERLDGLEGQIRDFAHKLEDVLEFHELNLNDDEEVRQEITSFGEAVKKMEKDYIDELSRDNDHNDDDDDDDNDDDDAVNIDFGVEMVGHASEFEMIQKQLLERMRPDELWVCAFRGKQGSGRTVYPKKIFEDARKGRCTQVFDCWALVTVDPKQKLKQVLIRIIAQVDNLAAEADYELLISQEEEKLSKHLYKLLQKRRYMIVLDDVHDGELVNYLRSKSFPDEDNGSVIFLTTTSEEILLLADSKYYIEIPASLFESRFWHGMSKIFFGDEAIPTEMEVAGMQIIQNCRCLIISWCKYALILLYPSATIPLRKGYGLSCP